MKKLHKPYLFGWTEFNEDRNIDFHSLLWVRESGNIIFDPLPLSEHDEKHLNELGKVAWVIVTNSDHTRNAATLAQATGASIAGPKGEQETFLIKCDRWLGEGDELVPGLVTFALNGSKTPGELSFILEGDTLITSDLIRAHEGGALMGTD